MSSSSSSGSTVDRPYISDVFVSAKNHIFSTFFPSYRVPRPEIQRDHGWSRQGKLFDAKRSTIVIAGDFQAYRAVQYFARFYAWYLLSKGGKEKVERWSALKAHLGTARKLLRLGKPIEHLQAALRTALANGPFGEQLTAIARQISYFGFLTYDAFVWANAVKFIRLSPETAKKIQKSSFQLWFAGILFSIINSTLKTIRLTRESRRLKASKTWGERDLADEAARDARLATIKASRAATGQQLIIDTLDIWIPATGAGLVNVNEGVLGIFGLITSVLGMKAQWNGLKK